MIVRRSIRRVEGAPYHVVRFEWTAPKPLCEATLEAALVDLAHPAFKKAAALAGQVASALFRHTVTRSKQSVGDD